MKVVQLVVLQDTETSQGAFVALAEMGHDDERHPGVRRHRLEKGLQRFDAARRGADAHHGKAVIGQGAVLCRFLSHFAN